MNDHITDRGCPTEEVWMDYLDTDGGHTLVADSHSLEQHLDDCTDCAESVDELRRFNTLLLRSRVPGLSAGQWSVLDERMDMMGSEHVPPPRIATKVYFGMALAAALGLFAVGMWHLVNTPMTPSMAVAKARAERGRVPAAKLVSLAAGAVEGNLEIADSRGMWRPLLSGEILATGARLRASSAARSSRLVVPGHFDLRVASGSEVVILAANNRSTWLRVRHGEVSCQVEKRRPNQQFKVLAGRFRTSVVGTEFVVRHGGTDAAVSVRVTEGAVRVDEAEEPESAVSETTTLVRAGNRWKFAGGQIEFGPIRSDAVAADRNPVEVNRQHDSHATAAANQPNQANAAPRTARAKLRPTRRAATNPSMGDATAPTKDTETASAADAPKVVEIKVPAQWHAKAHEVEVQRLQKLANTPQSKAEAAQPGATKPSATKPSGNNGDKAFQAYMD